MSYFKVLHNFDANDDSELSVKKDEIVYSSNSVVHKGWIRVEVAHDRNRRGFVPLSYLRKVEVAETQSSVLRALDMAVHSDQREASAPSETIPPSFTAAALDYGDRLHHMYGSVTREPSVTSRKSRLSEPYEQRSSPRSATATAVVETQQQQPHHHLVQVSAPDASHSESHRSLLNDPSAVVEAFMKNELHFKQLMRQRQDALAQMRSSLEMAIADVASCKEKNVTLTRKLRDLDQFIEKERKRWKERIEEEKTYLNRSMPRESNARGASGSPSLSNQT